MKFERTPSASRTAMLGLALLLFIAGCAPQAALIHDPTALAGRLDIKVSDADQQEAAAELAKNKLGPAAARATYLLGLYDYQRGSYAEAGKRFQQLAVDYVGSGWDKTAIFMMARTLEQLGDPARAVVQYQRLVEPRNLSPAAKSETELSFKARRAARQLVEGTLPDAAVDQLIVYPVLAEFQPPLRLKRVSRLVADAVAGGVSAGAKVDLAFHAISEFQRDFPEEAYKKDLERLARDADRAVPVDRLAVGLLLPQSGRQAALGQQLRMGAELAFEEFNTGLKPELRVRLLVEDEGDDLVTAEASARRLLMEKQVIAILGPLSSDATKQVLPLVESRRTPLLSSAAMRSDLDGISPYFFRNCLTPEKQAVAMADHALFELKVTRVAELYPDTPYGNILAKAFSARMTELGGGVMLAVSYPAGTSDFKDIFVNLGGVNPTAMKDADTREKREQQSHVEAASTVLGKAILAMKAELEEAQSKGAELSPTAGSYRALSFPARVAVIDFASSTTAAVFNAGRSFADRFYRVLAQLDEVTMLSPEESAKRLRERALSPEALNLETAGDIGRAMNADLVLAGSVTELSPDWAYLKEASKRDDKEGRQARRDTELFGKNQVFKVVASLLDVHSNSVVARAQFEATKLRPGKANTLDLQALYLPGTAAEVVQAASAMSFCDLKLLLLGSDLWKRPELLQNDNASTLEGARLTVGFNADSSSSEVRHFVEAFKKRYAAQPSQLSAQAYDAANMLLGALRSGAGTREELRQALLNISNFDGASGRSSFQGHQDAVKRVPILRVNSVSKAFEQVNP